MPQAAICLATCSRKKGLGPKMPSPCPCSQPMRLLLPKLDTCLHAPVLQIPGLASGTVWNMKSVTPKYPALAEDTRADVVVVGAGIAGLTCAYQLAKAGAGQALSLWLQRRTHLWQSKVMYCMHCCVGLGQGTGGRTCGYQSVKAAAI